MEDNLWGPIDLERWQSTPCLKGRVASEDDVKSGRAVFYFDERGVTPIAAQLDLPLPAILTDDNGSKLPVMVIQAEVAGDITYVGYRQLDGGNGICLVEDIELLPTPDDRFNRFLVP